jgi:predicted nicotinamide N-methyase
MPGYLVKHEDITVAGLDSLHIRSLLDRQQYADPLGMAESLGISSAAWPLFGLLWPSGQHLAAAVAHRAVSPGERILEIGCGLALASLVCHRRGADVTASDCHPLAGVFLRENLRLNGLDPLPYCHGNWATGAADGAAPEHSPHGLTLSGRFSLIMGSDVLYERDEAGILPQFIERHATPVGEVMIIDPNRGNRSAFNRRMAALGYGRHETLIKDPFGVGGAYSGRLLHYRREGMVLASSQN